jgi:cell division protease FtsH
VNGKPLQGIWILAVAFAALALLHETWIAHRDVATVPYSEFQQLLAEKKISEVEISEEVVRGTLVAPDAKGHKVVLSVPVDPDLARDLTQYGVVFRRAAPRTWLWTLLSWIAPLVLFVAFWQWMLAKSGGAPGAGAFRPLGQSKARVYMEKAIKVSFEDVAGVDEAKEELREVVAFLKDPKQYSRLGAHVPKGILLVGPPGTGKTLLARAVAGEAGVPFFSINGSEFVELFVGVGAARVRDLFEQARAAAPCIIFIDELDAVGRARGISPITGGGSDEKEQTLNQLLSELDGFDPTSGVVLLAATNRPEILDSALLRAGRFDRHVVLDRPDRPGRAAILAVHLKKIHCAPDVVAAEIAALCPGFTGADLANLVNEAATLATRRGAEAVAQDDFTRAFERIVAGPEKRGRLLDPEERRLVATHEMGHALVAMALPRTAPVQKISIIPHGIAALGHTLQRPSEDRHIVSEADLEHQMTVLLGGRAAEALLFDALSTGAADDLDKATQIARAMVVRYGMDRELGHAVFAQEPARYLPSLVAEPARADLSEETAAAIDRSMRARVDAAFEAARAILSARRKLLEEGAALLLERETLSADDLAQLAARIGPATA